MAQAIIKYDDDNKIIDICRKIRKLAKLDRMKFDAPVLEDPATTHLFKYLEFCGADKETFAKNYLANLQPYMITGCIEQEPHVYTIIVSDDVYKISLCTTINMHEEDKMTVSFRKTDKSRDSENSICNNKRDLGTVKLLADSVTGGIIGTNTKSFYILIPRGAMAVPVSLVGELQEDGTFLVIGQTIENALLELCNQYIRDLYASDLDFQTLNDVKIFSVLQQIPYTERGNSVFANISVLIDNIFAQDSKLHRKSASFALETYAGHLRLTSLQKQELKELIRERYSGSLQKDISVVIDVIMDMIEKNEG